ncbi:MAG: DNA polymerase IV [Eubacteriaceae bacterium]|nr:DNA polymerase IV [Eubacteriaceae bacterium]
MADRIILHSDLNSFYASVECFYNPELRALPVAVGGDAEKRHGIVLAKNELAKKYGVKTGEALWQARQKCPGLVVLKPNYSKYIQFSKLAREIYDRYTDRVESFGLDECWLDVSGVAGSIEEGGGIADEIRALMREELGVSVSIGVSWNKIFAKLGSDMKKPDATTCVAKTDFKEKVWILPVADLLYVGRATERKLRKMGVLSIGDLACFDVELLAKVLGANGRMLWGFANGLENSAVRKSGGSPIIKSIGNSTTTPKDLVRADDVKITLYALSESVASRLRDGGVRCRGVVLSIRDKDLFSFQRQAPLEFASSSSKTIFNAAWKLFAVNYPGGKPIRSLGVRAIGLVEEFPSQLSFAGPVLDDERIERLDRSIDFIRERFGYHSAKRALMLVDPALSSLDAKGDHVIHPESFFA